MKNILKYQIASFLTVVALAIVGATTGYEVVPFQLLIVGTQFGAILGGLLAEHES